MKNFKVLCKKIIWPIWNESVCFEDLFVPTFLSAELHGYNLQTGWSNLRNVLATIISILFTWRQWYKLQAAFNCQHHFIYWVLFTRCLRVVQLPLRWKWVVKLEQPITVLRVGIVLEAVLVKRSLRKVCNTNDSHKNSEGILSNLFRNLCATLVWLLIMNGPKFLK